MGVSNSGRRAGTLRAARTGLEGAAKTITARVKAELRPSADFRDAQGLIMVYRLDSFRPQFPIVASHTTLACRSTDAMAGKISSSFLIN